MHKLCNNLYVTLFITSTMTNKNVMSVFAIVAVAAMMGAASIAPAYAATKLVDDKIDNSGSFAGFECGVPVTINFDQTGHVTVWDNGKFNAKIFTKYVLDDLNGDKVGVAHDTFSQVGEFGDLPFVEQQNFSFTCEGSGLDASFHAGFTVHRDGSVTNHFGP